ncbi:MAG: nucleotide sugar dehydrogenase [Mucilaginibacter sp.]
MGIIGLGYVGLPLAIEFAKKYKVKGFDINAGRIEELLAGRDRTNQISPGDLKKIFPAGNGVHASIQFSSDEAILEGCNIFIITVPTPINQFKSPDLSHLLKASEMVGKALKQNDVVIYESTVYPGCTEDDCVPVLEKVSGLKYNQDFFVGYSPERISPGDKVNTLTTIKKVTSGSNDHIAEVIDQLYASIITAGTYKAPSIKVAEAAKAIENAQRDVNISFVNELALIFDRLGIDTNDVLEAAGTKWNFLKYKPGLVGGHCIGVDPYYLAYKAESLGYYPQVILSGRRVNDNMGIFVANKVVKLMIEKGHKIEGSNALILGITFKENCPDIRNTKVVDIYTELQDFGIAVDIYDPWADGCEVEEKYAIALIPEINDSYDAIILAVAHDEYRELDFSKLTKTKNAVIFDTKSMIRRELVDARL